MRPNPNDRSRRGRFPKGPRGRPPVVLARAAGRITQANALGTWAIVGALTAGGWAVGYAVGGAGAAAPHWFYLPIVYAAVRFGAPGALVAAVAAAVVAGPLLPLDVDSSKMQSVPDWSTRGVFFVLVGQAMAAALWWSRAELGAEVTRARAERDLVSALERDALDVVFEPVVDLATGSIVGMHAQLAWAEGHDGPRVAELMAPVSGSPMAARVGDLLLRRAIAATERLHPALAHLDALVLAVDLDSMHLVDEALPSQVTTLVEAVPVPRGWLRLELGGGAPSSLGVVLARSAALSAVGARIAIDDLCAQRVALEETVGRVGAVRIRRSYAEALGRRRRREPPEILRALVGIAHGIGATTVGEGIDTTATLRGLVEVGCELGEGPLFSAPLPADDFVALAWQRDPFAPQMRELRAQLEAARALTAGLAGRG